MKFKVAERPDPKAVADPNHIHKVAERQDPKAVADPTLFKRSQLCTVIEPFKLTESRQFPGRKDKKRDDMDVTRGTSYSLESPTFQNS